MATIGLDKLYYAKITEGTNGDETYGTPTLLAKAIEANLSIELLEAILYADDGADTTIREFKSGTLSLGVNDLAPSVVSDCRCNGGCKRCACFNRRGRIKAGSCRFQSKNCYRKIQIFLALQSTFRCSECST